MTVRPYIQKTIVELQVIFEASQDNPVELKKLAAELVHRKVPKAVALAKKVSDAIKGAKADNTKNQQESPKKDSSSSNSDDQVIKCEGCGQKLRIKLVPENREYTCPSCKSRFRASFCSDVLSVIFVKSNSTSEANENMPITLRDAFKMFNADESTSWEQIELTRRRLIQQYHPDKVASLGPKLRELAELEAKKINEAYTLLFNLKGS